MPRVLKSTGALQFESSTTLTNDEPNWQSALLQGSDQGGFVMTVKLLRGADIMAGIAPAGADISGTVYKTAGHYLYTASKGWYGEGGIRNRTIGLPQGAIAVGQEFHLCYMPKPKPAFAVSLDGTSFTPVPAELNQTSYVPCVCLSMSSALVHIKEVVMMQRPSVACSPLQDRLWRDRLFTDCTVACGSSEFRCHRAVLASASAVWRTALESGFREGSDAKLIIDDAEPGVVLAVLKFAYTGEFECDDAASALRLAHRYEMSSLVALCAQQSIEEVTVENVAKIASTLTIYLEHEEVAKVWSAFLEIIRKVPHLLDACMRQCKPQSV